MGGMVLKQKTKRLTRLRNHVEVGRTGAAVDRRARKNKFRGGRRKKTAIDIGSRQEGSRVGTNLLGGIESLLGAICLGPSKESRGLEKGRGVRTKRKNIQGKRGG